MLKQYSKNISMNWKEKINRMKAGPVFLHNSVEDIAVRYSPDDKGIFFAKPRNGTEYFLEKSTKVVTDAMIEWEEITHKEYENF